MQRAGVIGRHFLVTLWAVIVVPPPSGERYPVGTVMGQITMQITVERSGGFTGMPLTITVDTAHLPPEQAVHLRHLVEAADFFHLPATLSATVQSDRFEYEVTVQEGDRKHTITFGEAAMPERLRPLLSWLMELARQP